MLALSLRRIATISIAFSLALVRATNVLALPPDQVFVKASPSVVMVYSGDTRSGFSKQGSGVVFRHGSIVTNCHVVLSVSGAPQAKLAVKRGEQIFAAGFMAGNLNSDSCILYVPGLSAPAAEIADLTNLRVGQRVYAIGAPSGLELTLTEGLISGLRMKGKAPVVQTSATISPGSSGGGLFNENGELIGITSFYIGTGAGLNFAYLPESLIAMRGMSEAAMLPPSTYLDRKPPEPRFTTPFEEARWLAAMNERLPSKEHYRIRVDLLKTVHYEATRAGLDPQLVLAMIDVLSSFTKYAVSTAGARGYMQIMPLWTDLIADGDASKLFDVRTNIRMGCVILRHYLDSENGNLYMALMRYGASTRGQVDGEVPTSDFPNAVTRAWRSRWTYQSNQLAPAK